MAGSDVSEGQAVWQPGGAEEDSRPREGNRHLHLAYNEEEDPTPRLCSSTAECTPASMPSIVLALSVAFLFQVLAILYSFCPRLAKTLRMPFEEFLVPEASIKPSVPGGAVSIAT